MKSSPQIAFLPALALTLLGCSAQTDDAGACGKDPCPSNELAQEKGLRGIALQGDVVYYLAPDGLKKIKKSGGNPEVVCRAPPLGAANPRALVAGAGHLYWSTDDNIYACPADGAMATPTAVLAKDPMRTVTSAPAVGGGWLYWTEQTPEQVKEKQGDGYLMRVATTSPGAPARVDFLSQSAHTTVLADEKQVYWMNYLDGMRVTAHSPLTVTEAAYEVENPAADLIALDAARIYVRQPPTVYVVPLYQYFKAADMKVPCKLCVGAADGDWLVLWDTMTKDIVRAPVQGGSAASVASDQAPGQADQIAVDDKQVYWATADAIFHVPKPAGAM